MRYSKTVTLRDGRECTLRNGAQQDAAAVLANFLLTHSQTDNLLTYPDETAMTAEQEAQFLKGKEDSSNEIQIVADLAGTIVGTAGIECVGDKEKVMHRASFGISVDREYWGLAIGRALTEACVECAGNAGYVQLELEVVADNKRAVSLYESVGFREYGRNPKAFRSRISGWQETVHMRLELRADGK